MTIKSATQQAIEFVEAQDRQTPMICAHCGEHWLSHSRYGDYCPEFDGMRRFPKTRYLEAPMEVQ